MANAQPEDYLITALLAKRARCNCIASEHGDNDREAGLLAILRAAKADLSAVLAAARAVGDLYSAGQRSEVAIGPILDSVRALCDALAAADAAAR